ncbi:MAG TPA: aminoacyl-tRNA hydrolase [Candidatus Paceibacterota bacterium]
MLASQLDIRLIFGIGNADAAYHRTYHNVGILMAEYLKKSIPERANQTHINKGFMNVVGKEVARALKKNHIAPTHLLVIHDDSDIPLGRFKLSFDRNSAGHKGIESIIQSLKTKAFWRLRIGIRALRNTRPAEQFVLKRITAAHLKQLETVFASALRPLQ